MKKSNYVFEQLYFTTQYASESITKIPYGWIDKTICGCGLTTVAIENKYNSVIAVPSILLATNKASQYPNARCGYEIMAVTGDVSQKDVTDYINDCVSRNQPVKILVTYDSLWKVEDFVKNSSVDLIIDESDRLLAYAKLKTLDKGLDDRDVLTRLYELAYAVKERVSFISATPIPLEYMPDWIGNELNLIKMNWEGTTKAIPYKLKRGKPFYAAKTEIVKPILTSGEAKVGDLNLKKAIIFVNSVTEIVNMLDGYEYDESDVAIIAGNAARNDVKLRNYARVTDYANLPKITFVTAAGFQGIDLYDRDAISVIISNTAKNFTMIDLSTDLKQAISRQRDKENVNFGKYIFVYNQTLLESEEEELMEDINKLEHKIKTMIKTYNYNINSGDEELVNGIRNFGEDSNDFKAYTNLNTETNEMMLNEQIFNADRYFLLEIRRQYTKGFDIRTKVDGFEVSPTVGIEVNKTYIDYKDYANHFKLHKSFDDSVHTNLEWREVIELVFKYYKKTLLDYTAAKSAIADYNTPDAGVLNRIRKSFNVGSDYSRKEVKETLQKIYDSNGVNRKAKHSDLNEFFEIREKYKGSERYMEILKRK